MCPIGISFQIDDPAPVEFEVSDATVFTFKMEEPEEMSFELDSEFGGSFDTEPYRGDYSISPSFQSQTFDTKDKRMTDSLIVEPIRVSRVSNLSGGNTVFIGE